MVELGPFPLRVLLNESRRYSVTFEEKVGISSQACNDTLTVVIYAGEVTWCGAGGIHGLGDHHTPNLPVYTCMHLGV